jgi:hypothetical protein
VAKLRSNHSAMAGWNKCDGFTLAGGSPGEIESWWPARRSGNRARLIMNMIW